MEDMTAIYTEPMIVSKDDLDAAITAVYAIAGMTKLDKTGEQMPDTDAMKERVYRAVSSHVVGDRTEMPHRDKSMTIGELYATVFPGGPGTDPKHNSGDLTALDFAVRDKLKRAAWNLTNPNRKGSIQTRLGKEGRTEIVVRTTVPRGVDEIVGVFVTNDPDLILQMSVNPMVEKLLGAAKELRLHNELVVEARHPELAPQITRMIDIARKRVIAELTRPSFNGTPPALPSGSTAEVTPAE